MSEWSITQSNLARGRGAGLKLEGNWVQADRSHSEYCVWKTQVPASQPETRSRMNFSETKDSGLLGISTTTIILLLACWNQSTWISGLCLPLCQTVMAETHSEVDIFFCFSSFLFIFTPLLLILVFIWVRTSFLDFVDLFCSCFFFLPLLSSWPVPQGCERLSSFHLQPCFQSFFLLVFLYFCPTLF